MLPISIRGVKTTDITERSVRGILNGLADAAPAENLIHAGWSRCVGVADVADVVRLMLCAMAAGGTFVRQGNAVAW